MDELPATAPFSRARHIIWKVCAHFNVKLAELNDVKLSRRLKKIRASIALRLRTSGFSIEEIASLLERNPVAIYQLIAFAAKNDSIACLAWPGERERIIAKQGGNAFVKGIRAMDKPCLKIMDEFLKLNFADLDLVKVYKRKGLGVDPFSQVRMLLARFAYSTSEGKVGIYSIARCLGLSYATAKKYAEGRF